tara:strand:+ start:722 stop:1063 length:342 start_codon:yes stop_codon:yes gene_type:complete
MIKKNSLKDKLDLYFNYFINKDIDQLISLFSDEIVLRDWEIEEKGINKVKNAFINIFNNLDKINIKYLNISLINLRFYCEIEIIINEDEILKVVDIIDFDDDGLIISIKAFKG